MFTIDIIDSDAVAAVPRQSTPLRNLSSLILLLAYATRQRRRLGNAEVSENIDVERHLPLLLRLKCSLNCTAGTVPLLSSSAAGRLALARPAIVRTRDVVSRS